jgi:hypothetical protein
MLTTEQEAALCICPLVVLAPDQPTVGWPGCLGSGCMMWRWHEAPPRPRERDYDFAETPEDQTAPLVDEPARPAHIPLDWVWEPEAWPDNDPEKAIGGLWREPQDTVDAANAAERAKRRGFCGLAGRVEQPC